MISKLDNAIDTFIDGAGEISSALLGMVNRVGGQIYALLFLNDSPLSLDDISSRLQVSKSNVSVNIRMLEDFGLVKKVWVKGSRKDYYSAERVYPKKVIKDFLEKIRRSITDATSVIDKTKSKISSLSGLRGEEKENARFILDQLDLINLFYGAASHFFEDFFAGKPINVEILRQVIMNPDNLKNPIEK